MQAPGPPERVQHFVIGLDPVRAHQRVSGAEEHLDGELFVGTRPSAREVGSVTLHATCRLFEMPPSPYQHHLFDLNSSSSPAADGA